MWKMLKKALGSSDKLLDIAEKGGDKLIFTDEERHDYNKEVQAQFLEQMKLDAEQSLPTSTARRNIAQVIVYVWVASIVASGVAWGLDYPQKAVGFQNIAGEMFWAVQVAIGFYFGRHIAEKLKK